MAVNDSFEMENQKRSQSTSKIISKKSSKSIQGKSSRRRKSLLALVSPDDVTEGALQVWRALPSRIRGDPSLAPFQLENERVRGQAQDDNLSADSIELDGHDRGNDFIHIHVTDEDGVDKPLDDFSPTRNNSSVSNVTMYTNNTSSHSMKVDQNPWHTHGKLIFLFSVWFLSMAFMATESEKKIHHKLLSIDGSDVKREFILFA